MEEKIIEKDKEAFMAFIDWRRHIYDSVEVMGGNGGVWC